MRKSLTGLIIVWLGITVIFSSVAFSEETLQFTAMERYEPYVGADFPGNGFIAEIVTAALARVGYQVEYNFRPWARAFQETVDGKWHAITTVYYKEERTAVLEYSEPVWTTQLLFFTRQTQAIEYHTLDDLKSYYIGVTRGSSTHTELQRAGFRVEPVVDVLQNIKKILAGRVDLAMSDRDYLLYLLQKYFSSVERKQIRLLSPAYSEEQIHVGFSKKKPGYKELAAAFNKGLEQIKADGTYDAIVEKHGMQSE